MELELVLGHQLVVLNSVTSLPPDVQSVRLCLRRVAIFRSVVKGIYCVQHRSSKCGYCSITIIDIHTTNSTAAYPTECLKTRVDDVTKKLLISQQRIYWGFFREQAKEDTDQRKPAASKKYRFFFSLAIWGRENSRWFGGEMSASR